MKSALLLYLRGLAMGAADVVPGVSGGTIAFITGIYEQLLLALSNIPQAVVLLVRGQVRQAWALAQVNFLLILLAGVLTSLLSLARVIQYLLEHHDIAVWSFFLGLIAVSCYYVAREVNAWGWTKYLSFAVGVVAAWYITVAAPVNLGQDAFSVFMAGAIAICAMILPGISGSFLLLLMGMYSFILEAISDLKLSVLAVFALGCVVGLLAFARVLSVALRRYRDLTLALLTGFMLGSLNKVWPWKQTLTWLTVPGTTAKPGQQDNILPWNYTAAVGQDAHLLLALVMASAAILLVVTLEWIARRARKDSAPALEQ